MPPKSKAVINDENLLKTTHQIKLITLIDITKHKKVNSRKDLKYFQNQNFNTFIQAVSLRSQIFNPYVKCYKDGVDSFGSRFKGEHNIWELTFDIERGHNISAEDILNDIEGIPVHNGLQSTRDHQTIETQDDTTKNTVLK